ncbi:MAG: hypothetical protein EOP84_13760 [Verrucomicrobiaceae bacterium]|nr:MAG: hypothetical protein EOP84_13760 [Verrucomicrobiaceae bacterium]
MKRTVTRLLTALILASVTHAAELKDIAEKLVSASIAGDSAKLDEVYLESPTRERADAAFAEALPQIQAGKLRVAHVDRELVIGNLGVTLMRIDFEGHPVANFQPIIGVRTDKGWQLFPWASESDLKVLMQQRTPDEQIHLRLFDRWAHLIEEQIEKEAEAGTVQPATRPESKPEGAALTASAALPLVQAGDAVVPPEMWKAAFRDQRQLVWDKLRKDDGKVTASEVIEENYKGGSHHDGDRQLATAFSLIQLPEDPIPALRKMMLEENPERRAFAILVAGLLGDARLAADIDRLAGDTATLGQFSGDWFWDTVGDVAKEATRSLGEGGVAAKMTEVGTPVSTWLTPIKPEAEKADTVQPATRPELKPEGADKPQPDAEERSR